jgi:predicted DNA-binding transcriptional regulator AlpA
VHSAPSQVCDFHLPRLVKSENRKSIGDSEGRHGLGDGQGVSCVSDSMSHDDRRPRKMLSERQILDLLPIARSTLQQWEKQGLFSKSRIIGPNRKAWFEDEIIEWQSKRQAA